MKVIIAAAGTGGHINPGIAIANKIKEEIKDSEIIFIGTSRGLENDLVPRAGYRLERINAYGFNRKISINNFKNLIKTLNSFKEAKKIMKVEKPDLVIGTGGYICGPTILAAKKYKIPTMLHESNAYPGIAVKLLSNKVNTILVGFEDAKKRIDKCKNIVITGTPTKIRKIKLTEEDKKRKKEDFNLDKNLPVVLVFGGSQGAKTINDAIVNIANKGLNKNYQIYWAVGSAQFDQISKRINSNVKNIKIIPYIYNMEEVLNLSDLVVARSGAMTTTEIALVGKPAIFIPFPFATENHQEYNAKVLADKGAAKIILDKELNFNNLNEEICNIINNKELMDKMGKIAEDTAIQNVEDKIFKEVKRILKTSKERSKISY